MISLRRLNLTLVCGMPLLRADHGTYVRGFNNNLAPVGMISSQTVSWTNSCLELFDR